MAGASLKLLRFLALKGTIFTKPVWKSAAKLLLFPDLCEDNLADFHRQSGGILVLQAFSGVIFA